MTYLFHLFLICCLDLLAKCLVQVHFVVTIVNVNDEKGGIKKVS